MGEWKIIVPESTTNLITNPSFESGVTGWAKGGTNTLLQKTTRSNFGYNSAECKYVDDTTLANYAITLTAVGYTFSAWVYLHSGWDGGLVKLEIDNFASATTDVATTTTTTLSKWIRLQISFTPDGGDLAGNLLVTTASIPSVGGTVFVDGVQCEAKDSYSTTYIDGSLDGGTWTGTSHASTSTRAAFYSAGGRVKDFDDDFNVPIGIMQGVGVPPVINVAQPLATQDGELLQSIKYAARQFTLGENVWDIASATLATFHSNRQTLIRALSSRVGKITDAPNKRRLRYTGATVDKEIDAVYDGGLEINQMRGFNEVSSFRFTAHDPMFKQIGDSAAVLDVEDSASFEAVARKTEASGVWDDMNAPTITSHTSILAIATSEDAVYYGGNFTGFDSGTANADYFAKYTPSTDVYSAVNSGTSDFDDNVHAIAIDESTGYIYVCGEFANVDGVAATRAAYWDGAAWNAMGTGLNSIGRSVYVGSDGNIYMGGDFTLAGGVANTVRVAYWDGSVWNPLGTGLNSGTCYAITQDTNENYYVGGTFTTAGGTPANRIAKWNGTAFTAVGDGFNAAVWKIIVLDNGNIVASGQFTASGSVTIGYIAQWNGAAWITLTDITGTQTIATGIFDFVVLSNGLLYIVGSVTRVSGVTANDIALYNGAVWTKADIRLFGAPGNNLRIETLNNDIYLGFSSGATGTGYFSGSTSVTYNGTEKATPQIIIDRSGGTGTATLTQITNHITGANLYFDYAIRDGETITIDLNDSTMLFVSSVRGSLPASILPQSDAASFYLMPDNTSGATTNTITAFVDDSANDATITARMIWQDVYVSVD